MEPLETDQEVIDGIEIVDEVILGVKDVVDLLLVEQEMADKQLLGHVMLVMERSHVQIDNSTPNQYHLESLHMRCSISHVRHFSQKQVKGHCSQCWLK